MRLLLFLTILTCLSASAQEKTHDLIVRIKNIKSTQGNIRIGLYDCEEKFLKDAILGNDVKADSGELVITFKGLKKGEYAISLFHDKNKNGKLDTNFIGIPTEPYAFSNNAKGMFGPPGFEDCRFEVKEESREITISL